MKFIDIHSHIGFDDYGKDQGDVIGRMKKEEIGTIAVGADLLSSIEAIKIATENENIWACIGQHPTHNMSEINFRHGESFEVSHGLLGFNEEDFEKLISNPKVVAVGECGLDYYRFGDMFKQGLPSERNETSGQGMSLVEFIIKEKERQKLDFIKQINFAVKYDKPLMLHIRDGEVRGEAFNDAYNILSTFPNTIYNLQSTVYKFRGNVHFFTGNLDWAKKFIELGFTISFTGLITYVHDFEKIIRAVPLESLQAETDAPYVSPVPHRGERNEPSYVIHVYKKIAEIRGEDPEFVRQQLLKNAEKLFQI